MTENKLKPIVGWPTVDAVAVVLEPEVVISEESELVAEMAATSILNESFDLFIANITQWFHELKMTSEDGNPVRTHIEVLSTEEDVITEAQHLRDKLIEDLANRAEIVKERGGLLRKQVIDGEEE